MANEQNENAQELAQEQAENVEQAQNESTDNITTEESVEDLKAQIVKLEESLKLEKARAANAIYEAGKVKERLEREAEAAKKFALEKFAKGLLDSVDNLERAIQAAGEEKSPLLEGVELTLKSLITTLEKHEVVAVDTVNGFNADLHQAVGIDPNAKTGEIGNVLQKGYTLSGRLLRPAMVTVGQ
ncbi:nucleotide exchange factor GrpE [Acinetobacter populi]|uniref:Protein GrpE n=1 Tax=Acinetobacter populi TaxID=1582270 RepID=A0A1Z9YZZ3_9GAMM|nr:nucleotide exchange factor GrpE [Acinetobacter populi]OUY07778.1 nucleotide exchange factor GrpE [Acinetobacter populi]